MKAVAVLLGALLAFSAPSSAEEQTISVNDKQVSLEKFLEEVEQDDLFEARELLFEGETRRSVTSYMHKRRWTCVAKNRRGRRFKAQGKNRHRARRRAMRRCRRNSYRPKTCIIRRCRKKGGHGGGYGDHYDDGGYGDHYDDGGHGNHNDNWYEDKNDDKDFEDYLKEKLWKELFG